jgi:hypothetical protein
MYGLLVLAFVHCQQRLRPSQLVALLLAMTSTFFLHLWLSL